VRLAFAATAAVLLAGVAEAAPPAVAGRWLTADGSAVVEVAPCGRALCGRIARIVKATPGGPTTDAKNPDRARRSRPILGLTILSGFTAADDRWDGQIYDPRSGRTYRSTLTRDGGTLKVKGCFGPFCRTQVWSRAR